MWRRKLGNTDRNQKDIIIGLEAHGYKVAQLCTVGGGFPDLLVSTRADMWLVEVKEPGKKLNDKQEKWHRGWQGKRSIIGSNVDEILNKLQLREPETSDAVLPEGFEDYLAKRRTKSEITGDRGSGDSSPSTDSIDRTTGSVDKS